jgi:hypothetical protein
MEDWRVAEPHPSNLHDPDSDSDSDSHSDLLFRPLREFLQSRIDKSVSQPVRPHLVGTMERGLVKLELWERGCKRPRQSELPETAGPHPEWKAASTSQVSKLTE